MLFLFACLLLLIYTKTEWNSSHVKCTKAIPRGLICIFYAETFFLFQCICLAAGHSRENALIWVNQNHSASLKMARNWSAMMFFSVLFCLIFLFSGQTSRFCAGSETTNATWLVPNFSECVSPAYKTLHQEVCKKIVEEIIQMINVE